MRSFLVGCATDGRIARPRRRDRGKAAHAQDILEMLRAAIAGLADFDRPYDQWSNDDLKIRAKQLGVLGAYGHGELIDKIREAELRLAKQEAATEETS